MLYCTPKLQIWCLTQSVVIIITPSTSVVATSVQYFPCCATSVTSTCSSMPVSDSNNHKFPKNSVVKLFVRMPPVLSIQTPIRISIFVVLPRVFWNYLIDLPAFQFQPWTVATVGQCTFTLIEICYHWYFVSWWKDIMPPHGLRVLLRESTH